MSVNLTLGTATNVGAIIKFNNATGGAGNDILVGNASANVLTGGAGLDILIGRLGADNLNGGIGEDILIGGTTDHDSNQANLDAIMIQWAQVLPYATRIANLAALLNTSSVHNDSGAADALTGGINLDWFLTSVGDVVRDKVATETKTVV